MNTSILALQNRITLLQGRAGRDNGKIVKNCFGAFVRWSERKFDFSLNF